MAGSAKKYANALFNAVHDDDTLEQVHRDFTSVINGIKNVSGFNDFMENPKIGKSSRKALVEHTFKGVETPLLNLLFILTDKDKLTDLQAIYDAFDEEYNEYHNQKYIVVESTYTLKEDELNQIGNYFIEKTGYNKLLIDNQINEELIGGIKVFIGTRIYDGSINGQLESIQNQFKERTNS